MINTMYQVQYLNDSRGKGSWEPFDEACNNRNDAYKVFRELISYPNWMRSWVAARIVLIKKSDVDDVWRIKDIIEYKENQNFEA